MISTYSEVSHNELEKVRISLGNCKRYPEKVDLHSSDVYDIVILDLCFLRIP